MKQAALPGANVRASRYFIARTSVPCPRCGTLTEVTALALAPGHETLDEETDEWQPVEASALLFDLEAVSEAVRARLRRVSPHYGCESYCVNRCGNCSQTLHDQELHGEPGGGFTPRGEDEAAGIVLTEIDEAFEALAAGYTLEPQFFARMRRV